MPNPATFNQQAASVMCKLVLDYAREHITLRGRAVSNINEDNAEILAMHASDASRAANALLRYTRDGNGDALRAWVQGQDAPVRDHFAPVVEALR